jgi:outer membrane murein-binding lipoprotein Lpp
LRTALITLVVFACLLGAFLFAGSLEQNHMIFLGLLIAIFAGLATIAITLASKIQALRTDFQPTEPVWENPSSCFKNTANMHGYKTELDRQLEHMRQDVNSLKDDQQRSEREIKTLQTHMRICFDLIRYHEEITLPQALSGQAGTIVITTLLTLLGTAMTATPDIFYTASKWLLSQAVNLWATIGAIRLWCW